MGGFGGHEYWKPNIWQYKSGDEINSKELHNISSVTPNKIDSAWIQNIGNNNTALIDSDA